MKLPFYSPPDLRRECIWRKTHHHANWSHFHYGHQHPVSPGLCSTVLSYIPGQAILLSSEMTTSHSLLCPWTSRIAPPPLVLVEGLEFNFTEKIEGARKKNLSISHLPRQSHLHALGLLVQRMDSLSSGLRPALLVPCLPSFCPCDDHFSSCITHTALSGALHIPLTLGTLPSA